MRARWWFRVHIRIYTVLLVLAMAATGHDCAAQQPTCSEPQAKRSLLAALAGRTAQGNEWNLMDHPARVYLVSFVQVVPDTEPTSSRTQSLSLSSIAQQYPDARSILIDATSLKTHRPTNADDLLNAGHDWALDHVVLLADPSGNIRQVFGTCSAPDTFLLGSDGTVLEHWNGLIPTGMLALAVERAIPNGRGESRTSHVKKAVDRDSR